MLWYSKCSCKFQKTMDTVVRGFPGVYCLDGILIIGLLRRSTSITALKRLQAHGKLPKCRYAELGGLVVDEQGLHVSPEKTIAELNDPQPRNVKELLSFLNFYRIWLQYSSL